MKVTIECLVAHCVQLNIHGHEPVALAGVGAKKEFATHGDFLPYKNAARALELEGHVKVLVEGEEAAPAKVAEMKKEEPKAEMKMEAEEAPKVEEPKEEAKEEVKKPSSNKKK